MASDSNTTADSQTQRQVKYGLNVFVAIAIVAAIVVVINLASAKYLRKMRFDSTHSRTYSLSNQTRKLLSSLENDYQIIMLIVTSVPEYDTARDLIEEYAHRSSKVDVEAVNPAASRGRAFFIKLRQRYEKQLVPFFAAITESTKTITQTRAAIDQIVQPDKLLDQINSDPALISPQQKDILRQVTSILSRFQQRTKDLDKNVQASLEQPLPNFTAVMGELREVLDELDQMLQQSNGFFDTWISDTTTASSVKDRLVQLSEHFKAITQSLADSILAMGDSTAAKDYDQVRSQLGRADTVAILGPDQVRVLALEEMFRRPDPNAQQADQPVAWQFTGEEKITGALVSMEMDHQPMAVFVSAGPESVIGPRGIYQHVAERLKAMNFDVQDWSPMPRQLYGGAQTMPPQPPPQAAPGQQIVWIVPPAPMTQPGMPQASMAGPRVAQVIGQRVDQGEAALIMFGPDPNLRFSPEPDPMLKIVEPWAITPQVDRRIWRRVIGPNNQTGADVVQVQDWPNNIAITAAIPGLTGLFPAACPIVLGSTEGKSIEHWPLVRATGRGLWAETNLMDNNPKYNQAQGADQFTIAVAAKKDNNRLVVVAEPAWALDRLTTYGLFGEGTAHLTGARFPANAELFLNSVYWLADLEQLIAASARTQDIRRIEPISKAGLATLQWGLPLFMCGVTLVLGLGVWMARRAA